MADAIFGGRLVAVLGTAVAAPGGSNDHVRRPKVFATLSPAGYYFTRRYSFAAVAVAVAGAPPRHGKSRPAVMVAAAAAAPGGSDDSSLPSLDCQAALSYFRLEMESFKLTQRPVAFVGSPTDPLMNAASGTAEDCTRMLEFLLARVPVCRSILEEMIHAGSCFVIVESQAKEGYMKADALVNVIEGVKLVGTTFFKDSNPPEYSAPVVPLSADDVDKDSFFKELVNLFIVFYTFVYWNAKEKYGFGEAGAN